MTVEIEIKWSSLSPLDEAQLSPLLTGMSQTAPREIQQTDSYFDSSDLLLAQAGLSLRLRESDGDRSLQLKTIPLEPLSVFGRTEINAPLSASADLKSELISFVVDNSGLTLNSELIEQLRIKNRRQLTRLGNSDYQLELCLDHCIADGNCRQSQFAEVELELVSGDSQQLERLAAALDALPALERASCSKYLRARSLLGLPMPVYASPPPEFQPDDPAGSVIPQVALAQWRAIDSYRPGTIVGLDIEFLHKMRVATRRLRSLMQGFREFFDSPEARRLQAELKWLAALLGVVRDLDIRRQKLHALSREAPPAEAEGWRIIDREISEQRLHVLNTELVPALKSPRFQALGVLAETVFAACPINLSIDQAGVRTMKRLGQRLCKAAKVAKQTGAAEDIHQLRIQNKKLRYSGQIFAPIRAEAFQRALAESATLHDLLGNFQDAIVTSAWVRQRLARTESEPSASSLIAALNRLQQRTDTDIGSMQQQIHRQLESGEIEALARTIILSDSTRD